MRDFIWYSRCCQLRRDSNNSHCKFSFTWFICSQYTHPFYKFSLRRIAELNLWFSPKPPFLRKLYPAVEKIESERFCYPKITAMTRTELWIHVISSTPFPQHAVNFPFDLNANCFTCGKVCSRLSLWRVALGSSSCSREFTKHIFDLNSHIITLGLAANIFLCHAHISCKSSPPSTTDEKRHK